jgi:hypothetical protein
MPNMKTMKKQQNVADENEEEEGPPKIMTKNVRGQIRKYYFLKTVQSLEELDKLTFEVRQRKIDKFK